MLDHANLQAMATMMADHFSLTADDHCLLVLPLLHVNAICNSFLAPLMRGAQSTILSRFSPLPFLAAVEQLRPTYFSAVPAIYHKNTQEYEVIDPALGVVARGSYRVQGAVDAQPWLPDGPIPFDVEWSMQHEARIDLPSARRGADVAAATGTADDAPTVRPTVRA